MSNKIRSPKQRDQELDKIWDELVRIQEHQNKIDEKLDLFHRQIMVQRSESDLEQLTEDAEKLIEDAAKAAAYANTSLAPPTSKQALARKYISRERIVNDRKLCSRICTIYTRI